MPDELSSVIANNASRRVVDDEGQTIRVEGERVVGTFLGIHGRKQRLGC